MGLIPGIIPRGPVLLGPTDQGQSGQYLKTDGAGNLSFDDPVAIGSPVKNATAGSVLFVDGSGNLGEDNSGLYWDATNRWLGIGTAPSCELDVNGKGQFANTLYVSSTGVGYGLTLNHYRIIGGSAGVSLVYGSSSIGVENTQAITIRTHGSHAITLEANQYNGLASDVALRIKTSQDPANWATMVDRLVVLGSGRTGVNELNPQARHHITLSDPSEPGQIIQLASGQTANAWELRNSVGDVIARFDGWNQTGALYVNSTITSYSGISVIRSGGWGASVTIQASKTASLTSTTSAHPVGANKFVIDANGSYPFVLDFGTDQLGLGGVYAPTSLLDLNAANGYAQLRLRTPYTPTGTADTNGNTGDVAWDDDYIYIKTSVGWKRAALTTF